MKKNKNEEGYVLVVTIIIVAAAIILVAAMSNYLDSELGFYKSNSNLKKAFYAAESGVAYGSGDVFENNDLWTLNSDDNLEYLSDGTDGEIEKINNALGEVLVTNVSRDFDTTSSGKSYVDISSEANLNGVIKRVTGSFYYTSGAFTNAITAAGITFNNNAYIDGDLGAPINTTDGKPNIDYGENFQQVNGELTSEFEIISFEDFNFTYDNEYSVQENNPEKANKWPKIADLIAADTGTHDFDNNITKVTGDVKLDKEISGGGVLVVDGNLALGSNFSVNSDEFFYIIVKKDIIPDQANSNTIKAFIYAEGDININNSAKIEGSIYAGGTFDSKNTANTDEPDFVYNDEFIDQRLDLFENINFGGGLNTPTRMFDWSES